MMNKCDHNYIYRDTIYKETTEVCGVKNITRIDFYFCNKCLDEKEVIKKLSIGRYESYPNWWKE